MINSTDTAADKSVYKSDKAQTSDHASEEQAGAAATVKTQTSDKASEEQAGAAAVKERIDDTGLGGIKVIQNKGSGYGVDAVLLAAFAAGETGAKGLKQRKSASEITQKKLSAAAPESASEKPLDSITNRGSAEQLLREAEGPQTLRVADLGTGCGIAAFILHHKLGGAEMTGYDVNANAIERARRACGMNGLDQDITFICTDIKDIICQSADSDYDRASSFDVSSDRASSLGSGSHRSADSDYDRVATLESESHHPETETTHNTTSEFGSLPHAYKTSKPVDSLATYSNYDAVITNPPYFRRTPDEPGATNPNERYIARHETTADISDFARVSAQMLKDRGHLYMVHRPDRLADIICEMRAAGIEPKEMQMVVPSAGKAANIVLIHGIKGAGPELRILPEIAVHTAGGGYTEEILQIYERI